MAQLWVHLVFAGYVQSSTVVRVCSTASGRLYQSCTFVWVKCTCRYGYMTLQYSWPCMPWALLNVSDQKVPCSDVFAAHLVVLLQPCNHFYDADCRLSLCPFHCTDDEPKDCYLITSTSLSISTKIPDLPSTTVSSEWQWSKIGQTMSSEQMNLCSANLSVPLMESIKTWQWWCSLASRQEQDNLLQKNILLVE